MSSVQYCFIIKWLTDLEYIKTGTDHRNRIQMYYGIQGNGSYAGTHESWRSRPTAVTKITITYSVAFYITHLCHSTCFRILLWAILVRDLIILNYESMSSVFGRRRRRARRGSKLGTINFEMTNDYMLLFIRTPIAPRGLRQRDRFWISFVSKGSRRRALPRILRTCVAFMPIIGSFLRGRSE